MKRIERFFLIGLSVLLSQACGLLGASGSTTPKGTIAPIHIGGDWTVIDICKAIPQEDNETGALAIARLVDAAIVSP